MKRLLLSVLLVWSFITVAFGQDLVLINDSINKFQIGIPVGWRYGVPADKSGIFMAYRQKIDSADVPSKVVLISIFHHKETDLTKEYKNFLNTISQRKGFKVLEEEDKILGNRQYKYLVEIHTNAESSVEMTDCILLSDNDGEILMLTMATKSENIKKYRQLFDKIADSFRR